MEICSEEILVISSFTSFCFLMCFLGKRRVIKIKNLQTKNPLFIYSLIFHFKVTVKFNELKECIIKIAYIKTVNQLFQKKIVFSLLRISINKLISGPLGFPVKFYMTALEFFIFLHPPPENPRFFLNFWYLPGIPRTFTLPPWNF